MEPASRARRAFAERRRKREIRMGGRPNRKLMLWWCSTDDHDEDWFVVARGRADAEGFFEGAEGYGAGDARAERVSVLPPEYQDGKFAGWPTHELLVGCGARVVRGETPRVVELEGKRYVEGMLEHELLQRTDDLLEKHGRGRPNRTEPRRIS
jgi:hypothetical protein